jgi:hypothetical protein
MAESIKKYEPFADQETPKPAHGTWTLISPNGKVYQGDSPIKCVQAESSARIPAHIALGRISRSLSEDDKATAPTKAEGASK